MCAILTFWPKNLIRLDRFSLNDLNNAVILLCQLLLDDTVNFLCKEALSSTIKTIFTGYSKHKYDISSLPQKILEITTHISQFPLLCNAFPQHTPLAIEFRTHLSLQFCVIALNLDWNVTSKNTHETIQQIISSIKIDKNTDYEVLSTVLSLIEMIWLYLKKETVKTLKIQFKKLNLSIKEVMGVNSNLTRVKDQLFSLTSIIQIFQC